MTLIELMISTTLGLILVGGIATVFLATNRSFRQNELIAGMQDQARFGVSQVQRDLAMAGYWGGMLGADNIVPNLSLAGGNVSTTAAVGLPVANDCGPSGATTSWTFTLGQRVEFRPQTETAAVATRWGCVNHQLAGTDAFAVRHVAGQATSALTPTNTTLNLRPYHFYLKTNATTGAMIRWNGTSLDTSDPGPSTTPLTMYRYYPRIYYVRDFSRTVGDGIPTLCRKELCPSGFAANADPELSTCGAAGSSASSAGYYPECIAEGVEDLQVVWGLDTNADDVVDRYTSTPGASVATQGKVAQVFMRLRSKSGDASHVDDKTYQYADKAAFTPSSVTDAAGTAANKKTASYYRRVYDTTVQLRNPVN